MNKKDVKGAEIPGTGNNARKELKRLLKQGYTYSMISSRVNRSESTLRQIASGSIENVPSGLLDNLKNLKSFKS